MTKLSVEILITIFITGIVVIFFVVCENTINKKHIRKPHDYKEIDIGRPQTFRERIQNRFNRFMLPSLIGLPRSYHADRRLYLARKAGVITEQKLTEDNNETSCYKCGHAVTEHNRATTHGRRCIVQFAYTLRDGIKIKSVCGCNEEPELIELNALSSAREKISRAYYR